ncbi:MAG: hypothetical protein FWD73_07340 [Polyangiaceae bacterium]|nr:hypothetical protein [Polyangiaceae bacterium]
MRLSPRRCLFAFAIFSVLPLLVACPKKQEPVPDAAPPPPPPQPVVEEDAAVTVLEPIAEDADTDGDADADAAKATGPAVPTNVQRLKMCCQQLRVQAKALGASPEAAMLKNAAAQCDATAAQFGKSGGSAPELGMIKTLLAGRNVPPVCSRF